MAFKGKLRILAGYALFGGAGVAAYSKLKEALTAGVYKYVMLLLAYFFEWFFSGCPGSRGIINENRICVGRWSLC